MIRKYIKKKRSVVEKYKVEKKDFHLENRAPRVPNAD